MFIHNHISKYCPPLRTFDSFEKLNSLNFFSSVLKHLLCNKDLIKALINLQVDFGVMMMIHFY